MTRRALVSGIVAASLAAFPTFGILDVIQPVRGEKEQTMNPDAQADTNLVTLRSAHGAAGTVERVKTLLAKKEIKLFAQIDHAAGAKQVGMPLRPTELLIFGNPKAGTPLMQAQQTIALDLPLRVLVWEDESGKVWLTYRRVADVARLHHLAGRDEVVMALDDGLAALARSVTGE